MYYLVKNDPEMWMALNGKGVLEEIRLKYFALDCAEIPDASRIEKKM